MMYSEIIRDFARRTQKNLTAIEQLRADGHEVYEATQLVNSMLGLLIFPQQEYIGRIPNTPFHELIQEGWPLPKVRGQFSQVADLKQLVRYLRNAIAHFNIEFVGDGQGSIWLLRVWNENRGTKTWEAELTLADIRQIAERFIDLLLDEDEPDRAAVRTEPAKRACEVTEVRRDLLRAYEPWNAEEEGRLRQRHSEGAEIAVLATELGRRPGAIRSRLKRLGLA